MSDSTLQTAADEFIRAYQICQLALKKEKWDEQAANEKRLAQIRTVKSKNIAIARNQAAQKLIEHKIKLHDSAEQALGTQNGILNTAEYIHLGEARLSGKMFGVNNDINIPVVVPLLGNGNIFVSTSEDEINSVCSGMLLDALQRTAPGQLQVVAYDPALSGALAPFSALEKDANLLRVFTGANELEVIIEDVIAVNRAAMELTMGADGGIIAFRKKVNQPVGTLKVVVLLDFPRGLTEYNFTQFTDLLARSPKNGISFLLLSRTSAVLPKWLDLRKIAQYTNCFRKTGGSYVWDANENLQVSLNCIADPCLLSTQVNEIVKRSMSEAVPTISLSQIEDTIQPWTRSSANELTFCIGKQGLERVEINLADETKGTYNAVISGAVGQGKSNLLKIIIHSLCARYSPEELNLYLLDFKEGVTLFPFSNLGSPDFLPQAKVLGLESDREFGLAVLKTLEQEFARRAALIKPYGDKLSQYRMANSDKPMPRIVLMIDEFHFLFNTTDEIGESAANMLEALARKGRAYGIHLILASQTISGAAALLLKEDGIFGQIPVRIALKNSVAESYATFMHGNDAAARLRTRGQAVLNLNYGTPSDNRQFTVAYAGNDELDKMRINWWNRVRERAQPPIVFSGGEAAHFNVALPALNDLRKRVLDGESSRSCLIGLPIAVERSPFGISMTENAGRNIAIIGSGQNAAGESSSNLSVGIMQAVAVSLALQHPQGDARFVAFEQLEISVAAKNGFDEWLKLMQRLGFPVEIIPDRDTSDFLRQAKDQLTQSAEQEESLYILGFAMDRARTLSRQDPISSESGLDYFRDILRDGAMNRVHFIGAWTNMNTYQNHLGFGNEGYIETRIILRLNESSTQSLLGPFVHWSVRDNRALVSDATQLEEPQVIVPFVPLTRNVVNKVLSYNWE